MKKKTNIRRNTPVKDLIEQDILLLISRVSILYLMVDGATKCDERVGMALEEISRQLDSDARRLLESWEIFSQYSASGPESQQLETGV